LFCDDEGRVMLVRPTYKPHWDIPGGYVEPDESPYQACLREVGEEPGITPRLGDLLVVDWAPANHEGDKILYIFDGGTLSQDYLGGRCVV
jgi:8-oxo-dGTP diphosphatase